MDEVAIRTPKTVETAGMVVAAAKQWWLKVNTKAVRLHSPDGAVFPHIIKVRYTVGGRDYFCRKWISAGRNVPAVGSTVQVCYREDKPTKAKVVL